MNFESVPEDRASLDEPIGPPPRMGSEGVPKPPPATLQVLLHAGTEDLLGEV